MIMIDLLQIVDTANKITGATDTKTGGGSLSLFDLISMGGWIMVPLGILLLLAIYFFAERYIAIRKASRIDPNFMNIIRDHIVSGNVAAAQSFARNTDNTVARVINKGIQRIGKPIANIHESMENVGQLEMYHLERNMIFLSFISKAAPIFGFVGTLVGLMKVLSQIHNANEVAIGSVAGGIYTKLITSISGLLIGLIAYFAHSYLNAQIDKTANKMEAASADFLDVLQEPTR
jgi:biopolymer transport protein ExbB